jgi:hypothetical protein
VRILHLCRLLALGKTCLLYCLYLAYFRETMASTILHAAKNALRSISNARSMSTGAGEGFKVAVLGAAGGIGQPLSLLMKV